MKLLTSLRPETRLGRPVALTSVLALLIATIPGPALASVAKPIERFVASLEERPDGHAGPMAKSRLLTADAMKHAQGKTGENPYLAGQAKWDVVYKGVNLMSGNYSTSGTDLTFEGGYGIPVNVTRSYSANNPDEGPLGKGWTLSVDVRSTAGGLIKSGGAPVCAVPTAFKERPKTQMNDPNAEMANGLAAQPVEAVLATDAGGVEETIQVDADGVLTTPPWDRNMNETTYENVVQMNGDILRRTLTNKTFTPDGTVYVYARKGTYPNGTRPWDNPSATPEHSDVMKIVSATDRQGTVTTYTYGANATFQKANGTVMEERLERIQMSNGHKIEFTWTDVSTVPSVSKWRITTASDGIALPNGRRVQYAYSGAGLLTGVTTAGGKTTTYGYGAAFAGSGWQGPVADQLLTSITDPRGLTTVVRHAMVDNDEDDGHGGHLDPARVIAYRVESPNGTAFEYEPNNDAYDPARPYVFPQLSNVDQDNGGVVEGIMPTQSSPARLLSALSLEDYATNGMYRVYLRWSSPTIDEDPDHLRQWAQELNYHIATQNLISTDSGEESAYSYNRSLWDGSPNTYRGLDYPTTSAKSASSNETTSYNFLGNPLLKTMRAYERPYTPGGLEPRSLVTETSASYAYWDANKYYQQKAVKDQAGRVSLTDYFDKNAPSGSKGQTSRIWDWKHGGITSASGFASGNGWKYDVVGAPFKDSAHFEYDAKGRATDMWKLQSAPTSGAYTYVKTHSVYGSDTDGSWGQAISVTEDEGGLNRVTSTLHFDSMGRADKVLDAKGQTFATHYDLDGVVQSVDRIADGLTAPVVTYTYGTSGLTNGQVLSVKDELSGVEQTFGYTPSGGGRGQVSGVSESGGPNPSYSVGYTYTLAGDRETATYTTPEGTTKWGYGDYLSVGNPTSGNRVFQTLVRLNPTNGNPTAEEFHYRYDIYGRLLEATFAQTPATGYTPSSYSLYRDSTGAPHPATGRARAHYEYDSGGRMKLIAHWWDALNSQGTAYVSTRILANECDYETTGLKRGLKTASRFYRGVSGSWNLQRTETYGYDTQNDQLTSANYGDGGTNQVQSWGYDAAGNRTSDSAQPGSWTYDNLNRILSSPQGSYTHDVLGNRESGPTVQTSYGWDALGRMTSLQNGASAEYAYRADGMRVRKATHTGAPGVDVTTTAYDGQMPFETVESRTGVPDAGVKAVERHALGARGTDMIERTTMSGTQTRFPLYDAHGNSVGTLGRSGSSWTLGDERAYDAWGKVRSGLATGAPSARYCASLGHVQDDESELVYMRARYYEPGTGRFVSEDTARHGFNWYSYCGNNPVNRTDNSGKEFNDVSYYTVLGMGALFAVGFLTMALGVLSLFKAKTPFQLSRAYKEMLSGVAMMAVGAGGVTTMGNAGKEIQIFELMTGPSIEGLIGVNYYRTFMSVATGISAGMRTQASTAVAAVGIYSLTLLAMIMATDFD